MNDEVPVSRYAVSENQWIDQNLFHYWLTEHFFAHAVSGCLLLLLLGGHSSHFKPDTIKFAKDHGIVVLILLAAAHYPRMSIIGLLVFWSIEGSLE